MHAGAHDIQQHTQHSTAKHKQFLKAKAKANAYEIILCMLDANDEMVCHTPYGRQWKY